MEPLGRSENMVFRGRSADGAAILRLTHRDHRGEEALEAERQLIEAMVADGIPACASIASRDGRQIVAIGEEWLAMLFRDAARVASIRRSDPWTDAQLRSWGCTLGRMHAAAARLPPTLARPHWRSERILADALRDGDDEVRGLAASLVRALEARQGADAELTLIHADLHQSNLLRADDGAIHVFDFDDSRYHWPMYDLAVCASYLPCGDGDARAQRILRTASLRVFLEG